MFDTEWVDDPGDDLSAAAVEAAAVRACADAVELRVVATLVQVQRTQARREAERRDQVHRRERPGTPARRVRVDVELVDRCTAQGVSLALWLAPVVARARMQLALELVEDRPATFDALRTGAIDLVRARRIVEAVRNVNGPDGDGRLDIASAVEGEALYPGSVPLLADLRPGRPAAELTPAQLTARLARLVLRAAALSALRRTEAADERRGCSLRVLPDGMALLSVTGRMELLGAAFTRVDATAKALLATETAAPDDVTVTGAPFDTPSTLLSTRPSTLRSPPGRPPDLLTRAGPWTRRVLTSCSPRCSVPATTAPEPWSLRSPSPSSPPRPRCWRGATSPVTSPAWGPSPRPWCVSSPPTPPGSAGRTTR